MVNFKFVIATDRGENFNNELPPLKSLSLMKFDSEYKVETTIFNENTIGLSEIYNSILDSDKSSDFIVFVHDDIWINDVFVFDKLIKASSDSDIIGICGGKGWKAYGNGEQPIIWTHAARESGMSGFMIHAADSKQDKIKHDMTYNGRSIFASCYGNSPSRVLTIDGCFMCFTKKAVENRVRFDSNFKFHFYDIDMCFSAFVKKVKIGTAPILITHESLGYSVMQPEFIESQKKFLKKWFS